MIRGWVAWGRGEAQWCAWEVGGGEVMGCSVGAGYCALGFGLV